MGTACVTELRIAVLPSSVADQIAAGEVVERPASVVKELVENALDAGATRIDITVRDGGRALIRVSDDGAGMTSGDAELAVQRHATSKIRTAADLVGVGTFGFRGEALPAIASVSSLALETAQSDGEASVITVVNGARAQVSAGRRQRGTTVTVEGLFAHVPARLKFLRAARSEWRAIADVVTTAALLRCDVGFWVSHDDKPLIAWPPASSLRERVAAAWGADVASGLVAVDDVSGPIRVRGLVEKPSDAGTSARRAWLSVNGRAVRDTGIVRAAEAAYRTTIAAGVRPSLLLAIDLPGSDVDVNVHPAKAEVRFRDRWQTERAVERAVRAALGTVESASGVRIWTPSLPRDARVDVEVLRQTSPGPLFAPHPSTPLPSVLAPPVSLFDSPPDLTQLRATWILAQGEGGVALIDQHSAHERVLYERFIDAMERGDAPSQRLLLPLTLHLSPAESEAFEANRGLFARLGFEAEAFGGDSILVNSVPNPHPRFDAARCLRESLADLAGDRGSSAHAKHERLAATVACKAAIKAGEVLSLPEMRALYADLARTTLAPHDVHGRSTIVLLTWDELERRFGR
jgi:DNA mismatch repair protein MutL